MKPKTLKQKREIEELIVEKLMALVTRLEMTHRVTIDYNVDYIKFLP